MIAAGALLAAGCSSGGGSPASSPSAEELSGSPSERAASILGHAPTGRAAEIVARGTMVVVNDADFAPQSSIDSETGQPVGFNVDVAEGVADVLGLKIEWQHPPAVAVPTGLKKGRYDVAIDSLAVTPAAKELMEFTDPYYYSSAQAFVKQGGELIASRADLAGKSVAVAVGTTYYDYLKERTGAVVKTYASDREAAAELLTGAVDFWVTDSVTGQKLILQGKPIDISGEPLFTERRAIAIRKGESDWLALLDFAVREKREDGSLSAMSKKWYQGIDLTARP